jgi:hypothetical protein
MDVISALLIVGLLVAIAGYFSLRLRYVRLKREQYIRSFVFPLSLLSKLRKHHDHLAEKDYFLVARALRQFFIVKVRAGDTLIGMPSKVVDDLWHEFILDTRAYAKFCNTAFGKFFHHVPASSTPKGTDINSLLRVTWRHACLEENINPDRPTRLPLLFAIDRKLAIVGGNHYFPRNSPEKGTSSDGCGGAACGGGDGGSCGDGAGCSGGCSGGCGGD